MMATHPHDVPASWAVTTLGEACLVIQGQSPPGETYNTEGTGLPFLQGKGEFGDISPTAVKWCSAPTKNAEPDDVLISIRAPVGPTNLCLVRSCIGRGLAAIRPGGNIPSRFVLYGLRASEAALRAKATGTTFEAIRGEDLRSQSPPPPAPSGAAANRRGAREAADAAGRVGGGAAAGASQPQALPGKRAEGRLRRPSGPDGGVAGPRRGPRVRARRSAAPAHPRGAPQPVGVTGEATGRVQGARHARHIGTTRAAGGLGVGVG